MQNRKLRIGLCGVGHLGKIHLKCLHETDFEIVGVYDPEVSAQRYVADEYDIKVYRDLDKLIDDVDAMDIVSTTMTHFQIAKKVISKGKHAFIEKPLCATIEEAQILSELTKKYNVRVQVGHVERYNPAITSLKDRAVSPKFIEGHRLTTYNTRGNDVSVMLDLMIHDLDLVLHLVQSEVVDVQANGVCVVNDTPDICNARITFANDCVANLTASRISMKQMRKLRMFQQDEYISVDFLKRETQIITLESVDDADTIDGMTINTSAGKKVLKMEMPDAEENNAIVEELRDFHRSILHNTPIRVTVEDGMKALELAHLIESKLV